MRCVIRGFGGKGDRITFGGGILDERDHTSSTIWKGAVGGRAGDIVGVMVRVVVMRASILSCTDKLNMCAMLARWIV